MASALDLYTIVKNNTAAERFIGYLPPHGRKLAAGAELAVPGDLMAAIKGNRRKRTALENDLVAGRLLIKDSPRLVIYNAAVGVVVAAPAAPTVAAGSGSAGTWTGTTSLFFGYTWYVPGIGETTIGAKSSSAYVPGDNSSKAPAITIPTVPTQPPGAVANIYASIDGSTLWKKVLSSKAAGAHEFTGAFPPSPVVTPPTTNTLSTTSVAAPQSQVSASGSGSGGTLAAGTYKVAVTFSTIWGETSIGNSLSTTVTTTGSTSSIAVTCPSVPSYPAATLVNVYVTAAGADSATLRLFQAGAAGGATVTVTSVPTLGTSNPAPPSADTLSQPASSQVVVLNASGALIVQDPTWQK